MSAATTRRTIALILATVGLWTLVATADDRRSDPASLSVMTINTYFMWDGVEPEEGSSQIDIPWRHSQQEAEEQWRRSPR